MDVLARVRFHRLMLAAKQDGTAQHAVSQTVCGRVVALIAADVAA